MSDNTEVRSSAPFSRADVRAASRSASEACGTTVSRTACRRNSPGMSRLGMARTTAACSSSRNEIGRQHAHRQPTPGRSKEGNRRESPRCAFNFKSSQGPRRAGWRCSILRALQTRQTALAQEPRRASSNAAFSDLLSSSQQQYLSPAASATPI